MKAKSNAISHWWKIMPMLPSNKTSWQYRVLKRIWFDHTMQAAKLDSFGDIVTGGRGFNNISSEDHLTVKMFHNWSLFPNNDWSKNFLTSCGAKPTGNIQNIRWSFGYEEYLENKSKRPIADIVIKWKDGIGEAVLVIEAKKKGLQPKNLNEKDIPSSSIYLNMPSIKIYERKSACLLIDEADTDSVRNLIGDNEPILTWQQLASLQIEAAKELDIPLSVKEFVIGSLLNLYCQYDIVPTILPYQYLESEPSAVEVSKNKTQTTQDRQIAHWNF